MVDRDETDEKIIAIPFSDPQYNSYKDVNQLPAHIFEELKHFLMVYKQLENKKVEVNELGGADVAKQCIVEAISLFEKTFE